MWSSLLFIQNHVILCWQITFFSIIFILLKSIGYNISKILSLECSQADSTLQSINDLFFLTEQLWFCQGLSLIIWHLHKAILCFQGQVWQCGPVKFKTEASLCLLSGFLSYPLLLVSALTLLPATLPLTQNFLLFPSGTQMSNSKYDKLIYVNLLLGASSR